MEEVPVLPQEKTKYFTSSKFFILFIGMFDLMYVQIPNDFDWEFYLNYNTDLQLIGLQNEEDAMWHYHFYGKKENRPYNDNNFVLPNYENFIINLNKFNDHSYEVCKNHNLKSCKISVIITLYNYELYIKNCIESVMRNNIDGLEILIVNDNSTDKSLEIAKTFLSSDKNITIIDKKINLGLIHSRNLGIDLCVGDYVFILDADNEIYPNCLEEHLIRFDENKIISCYGIVECFDEYSNFIKQMSDKNFDFEKLKNGNYIDAMAMFDKGKLIEIGKYDFELMKYGIGWEDFELWLRIGSLNLNVDFVNKPLSKYLIKKNSMVNSTNNLYGKSLKDYLNQKYVANI